MRRIGLLVAIGLGLTTAVSAQEIAGIEEGATVNVAGQEAAMPGPDSATGARGAVGRANPAAVFCAEQGNRYVIRADSGGSVGICVLPDGTEVDAWAYFRSHGQE